MPRYDFKAACSALKSYLGICVGAGNEFFLKQSIFLKN